PPRNASAQDERQRSPLRTTAITRNRRSSSPMPKPSIRLPPMLLSSIVVSGPSRRPAASAIRVNSASSLPASPVSIMPVSRIFGTGGGGSGLGLTNGIGGSGLGTLTCSTSMLMAWAELQSSIAASTTSMAIRAPLLPGVRHSSGASYLPAGHEKTRHWSGAPPAKDKSAIGAARLVQCFADHAG